MNIYFEYILSYDQKTCIEFKNCDRYHYSDGKVICDECKIGYALSFEGKNCKSFQNCLKLKNGDNKCEECYEYYHPNADGKCERTLCKEYDDKDICTLCYDGYYLNEDKNCEKIKLENCIVLDPTNKEKCGKCVGGLNPNADGKCNIPSTPIKGCIDYNDNGKCKECENYYYEITVDGDCKFKGCKTGRHSEEVCAACKAGYYIDDDGLCTGYDGSKDDPSVNSYNRIQIEYALLIIILAFLI